ncbi:hypothetical protein B0H13DRAFT_2332328 [Mycena leptocephala]|nr:hypothetical protein B0H13DRAFT_2332328 [Mycena leptocephala]
MNFLWSSSARLSRCPLSPASLNRSDAVFANSIHPSRTSSPNIYSCVTVAATATQDLKGAFCACADFLDRYTLRVYSASTISDPRRSCTSPSLSIPFIYSLLATSDTQKTWATRLQGCQDTTAAGWICVHDVLATSQAMGGDAGESGMCTGGEERGTASQVARRGTMRRAGQHREAPGKPRGSTDTAVPPQTLTAADVAAAKAYDKELKLWKSGQAIVKKGIASTILDALSLRVKAAKTAAELWTKMSVAPRLGMLELTWKGSRHFALGMGADPGDDNFTAIILGSLPPSYDPYLSAITATSTLLATTLSPDDLIRANKSKKDDRDIAFSVGERKGGHKKGSTKFNFECYNCHKKGHVKADCWANGGGKDGTGPKQKGKGGGKGQR